MTILSYIIKRNYTFYTKYPPLFTKEITIIVECVLLGSFVYLIICYCQSRYEIKKVWDSYEQLKLNYKDILTDEDLSEIFGNDEMLEKMKRLFGIY